MYVCFVVRVSQREVSLVSPQTRVVLKGTVMTREEVIRMHTIVTFDTKHRRLTSCPNIEKMLRLQDETNYTTCYMESHSYSV